MVRPGIAVDEVQHAVMRAPEAVIARGSGRDRRRNRDRRRTGARSGRRPAPRRAILRLPPAWPMRSGSAWFSGSAVYVSHVDISQPDCYSSSPRGAKRTNAAGPHVGHDDADSDDAGQRDNRTTAGEEPRGVRGHVRDPLRPARRLHLVRRQARAVGDAKLHVLTHGLHYASCVFEGERAYGGEIFKSTEHSERLRRSAEMLDFEIPYTVAELDAAKRARPRARTASRLPMSGRSPGAAAR